MTTLQLTATQHAVLAHAIHHADGKLDWFPENIKGGARRKVLDGLVSRALITQNGADWFVAAEGYDALGCAHSAPSPLESGPEIEDAVTATEAPGAQAHTETKPRTRDNSKQATVIQMLKRPEGATVRQICEATGWQAHTVRGTFAGAFKKKLGLTLLSEKPEGGERVYRIG